jgi:hypothetical protein
MMNYRRLLCLGALLILLLPMGCNVGTPVCPSGSLQAVTLGAPQNGTITNNLTPVLSWSYPDPTCHPESYRIDLTTVANIPEDWSGMAGGVSTTWSPASPLKPGMEYEWTVWPINGSTVGPESLLRIFYTGPMCDTAALHAPILDYPGDGLVVHTLHPVLVWHYPDPCLPHGYRVDLSTDPTFTDTSLSGGTGNPSMQWMPGQELTDCTTYFWRVAPINDTTFGPFSNIYVFHTDEDGECSPEPTATVRGMLWYDQCSVPLDASPVPDPLPEGCVVDSYGVDADGIHQPGEPSILNVTVNLGPGDCPVGGPMATITNMNGLYSFSGLTPGKYCLNVNAASFLGPGGTGHWTLIPSGHEGNTYRSIFLTAGETLGGQDFAWYQYASGSTPTPVQGFSFTPSQNANCRAGPAPAFAVLDFALQGTSYPIDGRNLEGTWLHIMLDANNGCWVLTNTGTASGDLSGVRVLFSPATPTTVVDCADYTDQESCQAQPACQWKRTSSAVAVTYSCVNK